MYYFRLAANWDGETCRDKQLLLNISFVLRGFVKCDLHTELATVSVFHASAANENELKKLLEVEVNKSTVSELPQKTLGRCIGGEFGGLRRSASFNSAWAISLEMQP